MGATFIVNGDEVTIQLQWVGVPLVRAQNIIGNAALYDHMRGLAPTREDEETGLQVPIPFDELTNQQKLDMVFVTVRRLVEAQADAAYQNTQLDLTRVEAAEYARQNLRLETE